MYRNHNTCQTKIDYGWSSGVATGVAAFRSPIFRYNFECAHGRAHIKTVHRRVHVLWVEKGSAYWQFATTAYPIVQICVVVHVCANFQFHPPLSRFGDFLHGFTRIAFPRASFICLKDCRMCLVWRICVR